MKTYSLNKDGSLFRSALKHYRAHRKGGFGITPKSPKFAMYETLKIFCITPADYYRRRLFIENL